MENQLDELKKKQTAASQPAGAEDLAKQIEEQTQKLNQATAKRAQLKDSVYLWRYSGKQFTTVIRAG